MLEQHALAIIGVGIALMALGFIRPSSGMRRIVLGLLLAAIAILGMSVGFRHLLETAIGRG